MGKGLHGCLRLREKGVVTVVCFGRQEVVLDGLGLGAGMIE